MNKLEFKKDLINDYFYDYVEISLKKIYGVSARVGAYCINLKPGENAIKIRIKAENTSNDPVVLTKINVYGFTVHTQAYIKTGNNLLVNEVLNFCIKVNNDIEDYTNTLLKIFQDYEIKIYNELKEKLNDSTKNI
ncbi:hypothetical protein K7E43_001625 [Campylobacter coli]|nr:hypothetical protein [Campylobacter coli]EAJ6667567.1 hypothetical protein [Campylobacter coli]EHA5531094.1 hypothetical protein [Campylobacter coli]EHL3437129.1 hypothetical protein [Campylobacter coli]EHN0710206.1 hypothetical protein [Campylobacter coli]